MTRVSVERCHFATLPDGSIVEQFTLTSQELKVSLITFGACVTNVILRANNLDVCPAYPDVKGYLENPFKMGATVGRVINRLANGRFRIDGQEFQVDKNYMGKHCIHGGSKDFVHYNWKVVEELLDHSSVTLMHVSNDGDMGFPGTLQVTAKFSLQAISLADGTKTATIFHVFRKYASKLYNDDRGKQVPCVFTAGKMELVHSKSVLVQEKLINLSKDEEVKILRIWGLHNEFQMRTLLERFSPFLLNPMTMNCSTLFLPLASFKSITETKLKKLADFLKIPPMDVMDELIAFRLGATEAMKKMCLKEHFVNGNLAQYRQISAVIESTLLVCTHNMIVESGFSNMKNTETLHMGQMNVETYNALRTIQDFWDVNNFEQSVISNELIMNVKAASKRYHEIEKEKVINNSRKRTYAEQMRQEVHVFKRRSTFAVQKEINQNADELEKARQLVNSLEAKQNLLQAARDAPSTSFL